MPVEDEPDASHEADSIPQKPNTESDEIRSSPSSLGEGDFQKYLKGEGDNQFARVLGELALGNKIAAVYIDARSGGVFFQGNAQVGGDVTGRDSARYAKTTAVNERAAVGHILVTDIKKIEAVYVECKLYPAAVKQLAENHLVILQGRAHTGKWTTGIHLLNKLHSQNVIELDPTAKFDQLKESIAPKRGYIVDSMSGEGMESLSSFSLTHLRETLREKDSHLVITVDGKTNLSHSASTSYTILWDMQGDAGKILEKHLDWYAPSAKTDKKSELKDDEAVRSLLAVKLLPGEIDRLAELLGSVLNGQLDLTAALARYNARASEQVKVWFDENSSVDDRLFMITVAVFNGAAYQTIAGAENQLKALLPREDAPPVTSVFGPSRSQRIRQVRAQLKPGVVYNELGRVPVEVVELDNPNMQPAVLQFVWDEFGHFRAILVQWLNHAALDSSFDTRIRAAAAVGELSKWDFNEIRSKIILPWAKSDDVNARVSAAMALGIPAWNSETAPLVLKLLHHWSTINNWKLCWTASAAYGGLAGVRFLDAALQDLRHIAGTGDPRLLGVLAHSMKNLFDAGEQAPEYRQKVLDALMAWTEKPKTVEGIFGLAIFLSIAERSWQKADPEGDDWPSLLCLAKREAALANQIYTLWIRAFNVKTSRSTAFLVLERWLRIVQTDNRLEEACTLLIKQISSGEDQGKEGRMRSYLEQWKRKTDTAEIAARLLDKLY